MPRSVAEAAAGPPDSHRAVACQIASTLLLAVAHTCFTTNSSAVSRFIPRYTCPARTGATGFTGNLPGPRTGAALPCRSSRCRPASPAATARSARSAESPPARAPALVSEHGMIQDRNPPFPEIQTYHEPTSLAVWPRPAGSECSTVRCTVRTRKERVPRRATIESRAGLPPPPPRSDLAAAGCRFRCRYGSGGRRCSHRLSPPSWRRPAYSSAEGAAALREKVPNYRR